MVIYIGNLSVDTSEHDLKKRFEQYGPVKSVNIIRDEISGNKLGFAFVKMPDRNTAHQAIAGLNRTRIDNRIVMVCETTPRIERRRLANKPSMAFQPQK
jgi:RNA recognition motif-containing protein